MKLLTSRYTFVLGGGNFEETLQSDYKNSIYMKE